MRRAACVRRSFCSCSRADRSGVMARASLAASAFPYTQTTLRVRHREQGFAPSHCGREEYSAVWRQWRSDGATDLGLAHFAALACVLRA